jgi:hypothetical protein
VARRGYLALLGLGGVGAPRGTTLMSSQVAPSPGGRSRASGKVVVVNRAQKALLDRLRYIIEETPKSGALNAGKRPLYVTRFARAVEARANDGEALVAYIRAKVYEPATTSYNALVAAGAPDLTVEAAVADADAEWASEFTDLDRATARERLGTMVEMHREERTAADAAAEAEAVEHDRKIVADVDASRIAKGKPPLTPEQKASMLERRAAARSATGRA